MWGVIRELVAGGTSVLLTTQYLEEADALADHVTFIDAGRRIADGTPEELKARVGQAQLRLRFHSPVDAAAAATSLQEFSGIARGLVVHLPLPDGRDAGLRALKAAVDSLDRVGVVPDRFEVQDPTLDDVYFQLTGRSRPAAEAVTENTQKEKKR
jgi:ABC-2 type transport system ATP-binding protein